MSNFTGGSIPGTKSYKKDLEEAKKNPIKSAKDLKKEALKVERIKRRNERLAKAKGRGKPGSSKGAMAAKAAALARKKAGKSTLGEFTGPDRGKKAAQALAKKRIAEKKKVKKVTSTKFLANIK